MTETVTMFRRKEWDNQGRLGLDKGLREAVADHLRHRWPTNTAKNAAREYRLTLDQARHATSGNASIATVEAILKHGGWRAALPILADVIGLAVDQFINRERKAHAEHAARLGALAGGYLPLAADRPADDPDVLGPPRQRGGAGSDRKAQGQGRRAGG